MVLPTRPAVPRRGLSLLEVLVALAVFLLSFVAIGRLVSSASDYALDIQYQSQATQLAQSKLNEVVAGVVQLESGSGSFDEAPEWQWSVDAEQGSVDGIWNVTVKVSRPNPDGGEEISASLAQMVIDPSMRGSALDQIPVPSGSDSTTTSGANSNSSSQQQQQQTSGNQPSTGGNTTKPSTGGTTAKPSTGGTTKPSTGGTTKPSTGGTTPSSGTKSGGTTTPAPSSGTKSGGTTTPAPSSGTKSGGGSSGGKAGG